MTQQKQADPNTFRWMLQWRSTWKVAYFVVAGIQFCQAWNREEFHWQLSNAIAGNIDNFESKEGLHL